MRPTQVLAQGPGPEKFHVFDGSHVAEFVLVLKSWSAFSSAGDMAITEVIRQSKNQCPVVATNIINEDNQCQNCHVFINLYWQNFIF